MVYDSRTNTCCLCCPLCCDTKSVTDDTPANSVELTTTIGDIDARRSYSKLQDNKEETSKSYTNTMNNEASSIVMEKLGNFILKSRYVKLFIIFMFIAYLCGALFGVIGLHAYQDSADLVPNNSYLQEYFQQYEKYFNIFGTPIDFIFDKPLDYSSTNIFSQINDFINHAKTDKCLLSSDFAMTSWIHSYREYLNTTYDINSIDSAAFYDILYNEYLNNIEGERYIDDIWNVIIAENNNNNIVDNKSYPFLAEDIGEYSYKYINKSRISINVIPYGVRTDTMANCLNNFKSLQNKYEGDLGVYYSLHGSDMLVIAEADLITITQTIRNLCYAVFAAMIITMILIPFPSVTLFVMTTVAQILFGVLGYMSLWGLPINTTTMISTVMCVGFSVDNVAHFCHAYMNAPITHITESKKEERKIRVLFALNSVGMPILAGDLTTIIALLPLSVSNSEIFISFWKCISLVMLFGAGYACLYLPVILSLIGPTKIKQISKQKHKINITKKWSPNILSSITFEWISEFITIGKDRALNENDIPQLPIQHQSNKLLKKFTKVWLDHNGKTAADISLISVVLKFVKPWRYIMWVLSSVMIYWTFAGLTALFVRFLLQYLDGEVTMTTTQAYLYATGLSVSVFTMAFINHIQEYRISEICAQVKSALTVAIFDKSFKIHNNAYDTSKILNLMVSDLQKFEQFLTNLPSCFAPFLLIACLFYIASDTKEWLILLGLGVCLLLIPILGSTAPQFAKLKKKILFYTDRRLKLIKETIIAYLDVKMYQWEPTIYNLVKDARKEEVKYLMSKGRLSAITFSIMIISESLIIFVISISNYYVYGRLYLSDIYPVFLLYFSLKATLIFYIPVTIQCYYELKVSMQRIIMFMQTTEINVTVFSNKNNINIPFVNINAVSFYWPQSHVQQQSDIATALESHHSLSTLSGTETALSNINMSVKGNDLVAVTGEIASGKTALLLAILGELHSVKDGVDSTSEIYAQKISYCSQVAWIFEGSVRENILFGSEYNEEWYDKVIFSCSLQQDLMDLPHSDLTIIGERGINISGGQKARVNLARCVYCKPDILLLDDILSSVDSIVQKHIFFNLLHNKHGLMHNTLRILVTHQTNILHHMNCVIVMKNGKIIKNYSPHKNVENISLYDILYECQLIFILAIPSNIIGFIVAYASDNIFSEKTYIKSKQNYHLIEQQSVVKTEKSNIGSVSLNAYLSILFPDTKSKYVKIFKLLLFAGLMFVAQLFNSASQYWLGIWSLASSEEQSKTYYITTYIALVVVAIILEFARMISLYQRIFHGSFALHNQMFKHVLYTDMSFYESNPVGRILNRFCQDQLNVDEELPKAAGWTVVCLCNTLMLFIIIGFVNPYLYIIFIPLSLLSLWMFNLYIKTTRSLRRLEANSKSPIYSHFTECFADTVTVRAYQKQEYILDIMCDLVDKNIATFLIYQGCQRWLGFRVDICIAICTSCLAFSSINLIHHLSEAGFAIALVYFSVAQLSLAFGLKQFAETENYMTSTERIIEYSQLISEKEKLEKHKQQLLDPKSNWPEKGNIHFKNLTVSYRNYLQPVIKQIDLYINNSERIGIVGRTGSGKSTIFKSLFRLLKFQNGSIQIDGIDICDISLFNLRKILFSIPQDCTLFSSTLRYNLDPFSEYCDEKLIETLNDVGLITGNNLTLDTVMSEYGSNLSVGQCQLICVCRALLNSSKSKILLIDEATANIDQYTEKIIQNVFKSKLFKNKTVLTIAHRIKTVIDYDKILVLDKGKIIEFDTPHNLLKNTASMFYSMYQKQNYNNVNEENVEESQIYRD